MADGMLQDKPGRLGGLFANHGSARPAVFIEDGQQPCCIPVVDFAHARVITLEEYATACEFHADAQILSGHRQQV